MKLITAVVKPDKLDNVMRAVTGAGVGGLTVTEVRALASSTVIERQRGTPTSRP
jgi:nitrogen regulatory protein PII